MSKHTPTTLKETLKDSYVEFFDGQMALGEKIISGELDLTEAINSQETTTHHADKTAQSILEQLKALLPEKKYNNALELKKLTSYQRMKRRAYTKGQFEIIDQIEKAIEEWGK